MCWSLGGLDWVRLGRPAMNKGELGLVLKLG